MDPLSQGTHRAHTLTHKGFAVVPDPLASRRRPGASFFNALLATALFRCWHILLFFTAWATMFTVLDHHRDRFKIRIASTLLTVVGTVLGFVVSYRTTSSFERYNEGRRYWSQIVLSSRTFARTVWFHVPDLPPSKELDAESIFSRGLIEKKTVINLLEAFAVAVKHYLRGEDGIYYQDLYYLVKFLPAYALPTGIPSHADLTDPEALAAAEATGISTRLSEHGRRPSLRGTPGSFLYQRQASDVEPKSMSAPHLPLPATARHPSFKLSAPRPVPPPLTIQPPTRLNSPVERDEKSGLPPALTSPRSLQSGHSASQLRSPLAGEPQKIILARQDEGFLLPGRMPPKYHLFDLFPFSLLVRFLTKRENAVEGRGKVKGKKAARLRAKMMGNVGSHNLPLEISLYLSSYIASLQKKKQTDVPTTNTLLTSLNNLVDALTGLERILTTPIPFSYSVHLWIITAIYCLCLPSQIVSTMGWQTIPATTILAFFFFGFLVAGEEIESACLVLFCFFFSLLHRLFASLAPSLCLPLPTPSLSRRISLTLARSDPFGYDKNDLNLDHFTHNIIRNELRAITSTTAPDPDRWIYAAENDMLFTSSAENDERVGPNEWVRRGSPAMLGALSVL
ncbi:Bestrophin, RFP-TM, chloride channel-domain-containing protein [Favolaschia claudopus]|uniref:Bestrophin, RFP-TM, chloride channel-domain-containing protein n=1 Tax=Favolaschia claudopus TaxID=2862362 RepID=A0AAW0DMV1_9AGAR